MTDTTRQPAGNISQKSFDEHTRADHEFQLRQQEINDDSAAALARIEKLLEQQPTKEDMEQVVNLIKNVKMGVGVLQFSWNNASKIGAFLLLILGIYLFIKYGVIGAVAYLVQRAPI